MTELVFWFDSSTRRVLYKALLSRLQKRMQLLLVLLYFSLEYADEVISAASSCVRSSLKQQGPFLLIEPIKEPCMILL